MVVGHLLVYSSSFVRVGFSNTVNQATAGVRKVWLSPNPRKARNAITDFYRVHKFMPDLPDVAYVPEDPFDDAVSDLLPYVK